MIFLFLAMLTGLFAACQNENDFDGLAANGLDVDAQFVKLADDNTDIAGQLVIRSNVSEINIEWNTDSICNIDTTQTKISVKNGICTLPVKWKEKQADGAYGPNGVAYKAGVQITAGKYSKYVPLVWAERIDSTKIVESIPLTRAAGDALPKVAQITMTPTTVRMNYQNGGTMYVGLNDVPYAVFDISEFTPDLNIDLTLIPDFIETSRPISFKWTAAGAPSRNFSVNFIAMSEGISQIGTVTYSVQETTLDYIEIGGIKWAKGNLCNGQIATSQEMAGNGTPNNGYYYNWNSNNPFDYTTKYTSWSNQREPCPAGWRTPTDNEFEILIRSNHCLGTYKGVPGIYLGTTTQPSDQDRDNYVFLPRNGYRNIYGGIETAASMYWTSVLNPVPTNGQFYAYMAAIKVNEFRYMASAKINEGAFIRCVKSK